MTATRAAVTWQDITAVIARHGGSVVARGGCRREWRIASPTGGTMLVTVTLRPRWCSVSVDRWRTTDRDEARACPWFEEHVWPHVRQAMEDRGTRGMYGFLPAGGTYASAMPLDRAEVPGLLAAWLDAEMTWGIHPDTQWPDFPPHTIIPGPRGEYGGKACRP